MPFITPRDPVVGVCDLGTAPHAPNDDHIYAKAFDSVACSTLVGYTSHPVLQQEQHHVLSLLGGEVGFLDRSIESVKVAGLASIAGGKARAKLVVRRFSSNAILHTFGHSFIVYKRFYGAQNTTRSSA
ncbi:hypothetical protein PR001_g11512 [Phytophthora rubi]|uniref:Uncharacterized protein n=1 Tax=Phytophthora rubi TaxID=129364 RepID=A0A6A3MIU2_9STRA|nr:hypothetical protein PR001_g11512 [Phytophthora rubi]